MKLDQGAKLTDYSIMRIKGTILSDTGNSYLISTNAKP